MTINDLTISIAIHAIMSAFSAEQNFEFQLHIEAEAPKEAIEKMAGKVEDTGYRQCTPEECEKIEKMLKNRRRVRTVGALTSFQMTGFCSPAEAYPINYDGEKPDVIYIFYAPIIEKATSLNEIKILARQFVKHELRHAEQFVWMRQNNISPLTAMMQEAATEYGQGPLEADAWAVQNGHWQPIEKAMACFL